MYECSQGGIIQELVGAQDGVRFTMDEAGAMLVYHMRHPTLVEQKSFDVDQPVRMGLFRRNGVLLVLMKIGAMSWGDAPFFPRPGSVPAVEEDLRKQDSMGLSMILLLVDTADGRILNRPRLLGLPNQLSRELVDASREIVVALPDPKEYDRKINQIYSLYSTRSIVDSVQTYKVK